MASLLPESRFFSPSLDLGSSRCRESAPVIRNRRTRLMRMCRTSNSPKPVCSRDTPYSHMKAQKSQPTWTLTPAPSGLSFVANALEVFSTHSLVTAVAEQTLVASLGCFLAGIVKFALGLAVVVGNPPISPCLAKEGRGDVSACMPVVPEELLTSQICVASYRPKAAPPPLEAHQESPAAPTTLL